jgi:amicyanin
MDRKLAIFAVVAGVVLAVGVGALAWRASNPGNVASVSIVNYGFSPSSLTVKAGTTVVWTNMDRVDHTVNFGEHGEAGMGSEMDSGMMGHMASHSYMFTEPGTYEYHCDPHPYMTAMIVVTE